MKRNNITEGPAIDLLTQLKHMKEKGVKNFNEIPSNTQVYDAVSPPQNSGLYSSPASSNNPQQNLSNPPNQFTYNLSHINHPSHQQGSSGFINTGIL
uniref:Uncharacterized protein n=1 Tax=Meloidogyne enterolobii TaxID=390850 RepID=A0A6V7URX2_MELEN|nr:unnamed protein product [Meloidogyne enterolobii]